MGLVPLKTNTQRKNKLINEVHESASPFCTALKQICSVIRNMHSEHKYSMPEKTTASNSKK